MIRHALLVLVILFSPVALHAQEATHSTKGRISVNGGIGFASSILDTSAFLAQFDLLYHLTDNVSVGPMLHFAPQDGGTMVSMSLDSKYNMRFRGNKDDAVRRLSPFFGVGFGFSHLTAGPGDSSFLIALITGLEYDITDQVALNSEMRFNIMADDVFRDNFYFTWQMLGARIRF